MSARAGRAKGAVVDAATRLFGEVGYSGTTMRDIAEAVGLLPGSLYAHISSKEELLLEIVDDGIGRFLAAAQAVDDPAKPADERMRAMIVQHVLVVADNPDRTLVVFHQWRHLSGAARERVVSRRSAYEERFSEIVSAGVQSGVFVSDLDQRVAVLTILGALNWTAEWYSPEGPETAPVIGARMAAVLMGGMRRKAAR
jgi:AcrR family transcriptional regulator